MDHCFSTLSDTDCTIFNNIHQINALKLTFIKRHGIFFLKVIFFLHILIIWTFIIFILFSPLKLLLFATVLMPVDIFSTKLPQTFWNGHILVAYKHKSIFKLAPHIALHGRDDGLDRWWGALAPAHLALDLWITCRCP